MSVYVLIAMKSDEFAFEIFFSFWHIVDGYCFRKSFKFSKGDNSFCFTFMDCGSIMEGFFEFICITTL